MDGKKWRYEIREKSIVILNFSESVDDSRTHSQVSIMRGGERQSRSLLLGGGLLKQFCASRDVLKFACTSGESVSLD